METKAKIGVGIILTPPPQKKKKKTVVGTMFQVLFKFLTLKVVPIILYEIVIMKFLVN